MAEQSNDLKISIKIDVTKIIKDALYKGEKCTYLDATVYLKDEADRFGNHGMITQDKTKDLTENGKNQIIGNIKVWNDSKNSKKPSKKDEAPVIEPEPIDDLPF